MVECRRSLFYQWAPSKTISITSVSVFNAPLRKGEFLATALAFLKSPLTVSAAALSQASPTLPMEGWSPSSASVSV